MRKFTNLDVSGVYSAIASDPRNAPFPCGCSLAEAVGYLPVELRNVPEECRDRFCGLSNLAAWAPWEGQKLILDVGCGAGLDTILLYRRVGATIVGVDFSEAMLSVAQKASRQAGLSNLKFTHSKGTALPFPANTFEAAMFNGLLNMNRHRKKILEELKRVLRPHSPLWGSEIVLRAQPTAKASFANWVGGVAGAKQSAFLLSELEAAGFSEVKILRVHRNVRTTTEEIAVADFVASA